MMLYTMSMPKKSPAKKRSRQDEREFQRLATSYYQPESLRKQRPRRSNLSQSDTDDTPQPDKPKRKFGFKKALLLLLLIIIIPVIIWTVWNVRNASYATERLFDNSNALAVLPPTSLKSTDGRTNILLVGYSVDDPNHPGADLTDSIMILSMNKATKTGFMVSVPRDLYIDIPNYGYAKINEAFKSEGIDTLGQLVSESFGVPLHYHVIVNYGAVRDIVDSLGGISVNIQSPDARGLYDPNFQPHEGGPLQLPNGVQTIDGQTALRLTRARGATYGSYGFPQSDFNRVQHQQLVLAAIKNKLSWQEILDPHKNAPIFHAIGDNIQTDLRITDAIPFFRLFTSVPTEQIQQINLRDFNGKNLLRSYTTRSGQSALVPVAGIDDYTDIQSALAEL